VGGKKMRYLRARSFLADLLSSSDPRPLKTTIAADSITVACGGNLFEHRWKLHSGRVSNSHPYSQTNKSAT
jgi:hypothetical protein